MSVTTLNNNQAATFINAAVAQVIGGDLATLDLQGIVDRGNDASIIGSVEQFTKALLNRMIETRFSDTSYAALYEDPFFVDSQEWGAITQWVSVDIPEAKAASNWVSITSGTTTLGTYTIFTPIVHTKLFGKTDSWEIPIAITGTQCNTAWTSADELRGFVAYVLMMVDNGIAYHMESMDYANRNNFIAEKIAAAADVSIDGIHKVNLVEVYVKEHELESSGCTVEEYLTTQKALLNGMKTITKYSRLMKKITTLFNVDGYKRFTPGDRQVLQLVDDFDLAMNYDARTTTFHENLAKLPGYSTVPFWQTPADTTAIKVTVEDDSTGTTVNQPYVAGLLCDKWAILHTIVQRRVAAKLFEPEDITQYYNQFTDRYMNNLSMNAIVFTLEDVNPS